MNMPFEPPHQRLRRHLHNEFRAQRFPHDEGPGFPGRPDFTDGFPPGPPRPGFGGGFGPGFGPAPGFGFGFGFGATRPGRGRGHRHGPGRGRARRGNVRTAVLILLAERPMHGYEIIQQITERSRGWWRPSPGSVYPTLQLLSDEGLVTTEQDNPSGKRLYALTDDGRAEAQKQDRTPPWEQAADEVDPNDVQLREALSTLMSATMQLSAAGSAELRARAARILVDTRRQLYLLLADAGMESDVDGVDDTVDEDTVEDAVPDADDE